MDDQWSKEAVQMRYLDAINPFYGKVGVKPAPLATASASINVWDFNQMVADDGADCETMLREAAISQLSISLLEFVDTPIKIEFVKTEKNGTIKFTYNVWPAN